MPALLAIRSDRSPAEPRRLARHERDGRVSASLMALANVLEDVPREEAARLAGMTGQTLADWVHRYKVEGVAGLRDRPRAGRHSRLSEGQLAALRALVSEAPISSATAASPGAPATCVAWSNSVSG